MLTTTNNLTMSSREIAAVTNIRHDNVKRTMESLQSKSLITFTQTEEKGNGRPAVVFHVNKRDSYVVVAQLSPEFTAVLVDRWQELEDKSQQPKLPSNYLEALQHLIEKETLLLEQAPKVAFVDRYVNCTGNKGFRQVCKLLKANESEFRLFLVSEKIMYRLGGEWVAYESHIKAKRFTTYTGEGNGHAYNTAMFTPKGVQWVAGLWIARDLTNN